MPEASQPNLLIRSHSPCARLGGLGRSERPLTYTDVLVRPYSLRYFPAVRLSAWEVVRAALQTSHSQLNVRRPAKLPRFELLRVPRLIELRLRAAVPVSWCKLNGLLS